MESPDDDAPLSSWQARTRRGGGAGVRSPRSGADRGDSIEQETTEELDEWERQELELETRRLDFQVAQWKQQQRLRKERLQLKSEEINGKETLTRQQQQVEAMEIRGSLIQALTEAHKSPAQVSEYLALLEG